MYIVCVSGESVECILSLWLLCLICSMTEEFGLRCNTLSWFCLTLDFSPMTRVWTQITHQRTREAGQKGLFSFQKVLFNEFNDKTRIFMWCCFIWTWISILYFPFIGSVIWNKVFNPPSLYFLFNKMHVILICEQMDQLFLKSGEGLHEVQFLACLVEGPARE